MWKRKNTRMMMGFNPTVPANQEAAILKKLAIKQAINQSSTPPQPASLRMAVPFLFHDCLIAWLLVG